MLPVPLHSVRFIQACIQDEPADFGNTMTYSEKNTFEEFKLHPKVKSILHLTFKLFEKSLVTVPTDSTSTVSIVPRSVPTARSNPKGLTFPVMH